MTKNSLPNSRKKPYSKHVSQVTKEMHWKIPSVREVTICAFAHFAKTGARLFWDPKHSLSFVTCIGDFQENTFMIGFNGKELTIFEYLESTGFSTAAGVRRFLN